MSLYVVDLDDLVNVADAIRNKSGYNDTMDLTEMPGIIDSIQTGDKRLVETVTISGGAVQFGDFYDTQEFGDTFRGAILVLTYLNDNTAIFTMAPAGGTTATYQFMSGSFAVEQVTAGITLSNRKVVWEVDPENVINNVKTAIVTYWKGW